MSKIILSKNYADVIIAEDNFKNEPIPTLLTFSNETSTITVQLRDTPAPSLFARSISSPWSRPSEFSDSSINEFFKSMSVTPSACFYEYDLLDGLVFTNKGFDVGDYNDDEVCIYKVRNIGGAAYYIMEIHTIPLYKPEQPPKDHDFEINLNYNVERKRSFRGHEQEDCNDFIQIYIDDQLDLTTIDSSPKSLMVDDGRFCGQGNKVFKISKTAQSVTIVLISDKGGKYKQLDDWSRYMNDARRTVLRYIFSLIHISILV